MKTLYEQVTIFDKENNILAIQIKKQSTLDDFLPPAQIGIGGHWLSLHTFAFDSQPLKQAAAEYRRKYHEGKPFEIFRPFMQEMETYQGL